MPKYRKTDFDITHDFQQRRFGFDKVAFWIGGFGHKKVIFRWDITCVL